jgi:hypothetical protein
LTITIVALFVRLSAHWSTARSSGIIVTVSQRADHRWYFRSYHTKATQILTFAISSLLSQCDAGQGTKTFIPGGHIVGPLKA